MTESKGEDHERVCPWCIREFVEWQHSEQSEGIHKLTNKAHVMGNIEVSDCEVDQTTNQLTIASDIR